MNFLKRFISSLRNTRQTNVYLASGEVNFREIDVRGWERSLKLKARGEEHGKGEYPSSSATCFGDVETEIENLILSELNNVNAQVTDSLKANQRAVANVLSNSRIETFKSKVEELTSELQIISKQLPNDLHIPKADASEAQTEEARFKKENKLERLPQLPDSTILHVGVLLFLLVVESAFNATFYATGHEAGWIGGMSVAVILALLNLIAGGSLGHFVLPMFNHVKKQRRLAGTFLLVVGSSLVGLFNLFVGHYRESFTNPETLFSLSAYEKGKVAVQKMRIEPFAVSDFDSWILVILGIVCASIAAYDVYHMRDPYPGYGAVRKKVDRAKMRFQDALDRAYNKIRQIRGSASSDFHASLARIRADHNELDVALLKQGEIVEKFKKYSELLESSANSLFRYYRSANEMGRTTPPPAHFAENWKLPTPSIEHSVLTKRVSEAKTALVAEKEELSALGERMYSSINEVILDLENLDELKRA